MLYIYFLITGHRELCYWRSCLHKAGVSCNYITVNISVQNIFKNLISRLQELKSDEMVYAKLFIPNVTETNVDW